MKKTRGAWRGPAALVLAGVYALAVEDLMDWLGPGRFLIVSAVVSAVLWLLGTTAPHTVQYIAPPAKPVDPRERFDAIEVMWIVATGIVLATVLMAVLPSILRT